MNSEPKLITQGLITAVAFAGLAAFAFAFASAVCGEESFDAFLENYCILCHGPDKEKGQLRIHQLSRNSTAWALNSDEYR